MFLSRFIGIIPFSGILVKLVLPAIVFRLFLKTLVLLIRFFLIPEKRLFRLNKLVVSELRGLSQKSPHYLCFSSCDLADEFLSGMPQFHQGCDGKKSSGHPKNCLLIDTDRKINVTRVPAPAQPMQDFS